VILKLSLLLILLTVSCGSYPESKNLERDLELFVVAALTKDASYVINHLHKGQCANPVAKSLEIFSRGTEFTEIQFSLDDLDTDFYMENERLYTTIYLASGNKLKMRFLKGYWYFQSLSKED
jgi:hypothetical protein